jgi:hypothetical protein
MAAEKMKTEAWDQNCEERHHEEEAEHRFSVASSVGSAVISVAAGAAAIGGLLGEGGALVGALTGGVVVALGFAARSLRDGHSHHRYSEPR